MTKRMLMRDLSVAIILLARGERVPEAVLRNIQAEGINKIESKIGVPLTELLRGNKD